MLPGSLDVLILDKPLKISPNYDIDYWKTLSFKTESDWQKAIDIFEDRIRGRFFKVIDKFKKYTFAGFAVIALDCLLIETLQQFFEGAYETPRKMSEKFFVKFLTQTIFKDDFDRSKAKLFYRQIRCGILHQAEIQGSSRILKQNTPLVMIADDNDGLIINRDLFHDKLTTVFEDYITSLRNPLNTNLRQKFRIKMNYICKNEVLYFAYGSNMKTDRLLSRAPSAKKIGIGKIANKRLVFNKKSKDGSGKANIVDSKGESVFGVLFKLNYSELKLLDRAEKGYKRSLAQIELDDGTFIYALVYIASIFTDNSIAYDWYKNIILEGAHEHCLPKECIQYLARLPAKPDKKA